MKLGDVPAKAGDMDAFHVPSIAVTSDDPVRPGDHVKLLGLTSKVILCDRVDADGIADPWGKLARPGTVFWLCLNPDRVENLTHKFVIKQQVLLQPLIEDLIRGPKRKLEHGQNLDASGQPRQDDGYDIEFDDDPSTISDKARCRREGC